jgi:hypothetical protein
LTDGYDSKKFQKRTADLRGVLLDIGSQGLGQVRRSLLLQDLTTKERRIFEKTQGENTTGVLHFVRALSEFEATREETEVAADDNT